MKSFCVDWYTSYGFRLRHWVWQWVCRGGSGGEKTMDRWTDRPTGGVNQCVGGSCHGWSWLLLTVHRQRSDRRRRTHLMWMNLAPGKSSCRSFSRAVCAGDLRISRCHASKGQRVTYQKGIGRSSLVGWV